MALEPKQRLFVDEYLKCFNAAEAARRAGYSTERARFTGCNLLKNPEIAEIVRQRLTESAMSAEEVLHHLTEIGRGKHADYWVSGEGGYVTRFDMKACIDAGDARLIKKVKPCEWGNEIEFYDRLSALDKLARYHSLLTEKVDVAFSDLPREEIIARGRAVLKKLDPPGPE